MSHVCHFTAQNVFIVVLVIRYSRVIILCIYLFLVKDENVNVNWTLNQQKFVHLSDLYLETSCTNGNFVVLIFGIYFICSC
jgi:hypothetical protein